MFGKTVEEELMRLRQVFGRMRGAGLKLKPSKCVLFQKSVTYLGHIVSSEEVATDPTKPKLFLIGLPQRMYERSEVSSVSPRITEDSFGDSRIKRVRYML